MDRHITPFEIDDEKLKKLFSYYLHLAPTIDSGSSRLPPVRGLNVAWNDFITQLSLGKTDYHIYSSGSITTDYLKKYKLLETDTIKKKSRRFVCCLRDKNEDEMTCLLRHLRNSIAHSRVFLYQTKSRKFFLFNDYNTKKNLAARILLSQTDLERLKRILL